MINCLLYLLQFVFFCCLIKQFQPQYQQQAIQYNRPQTPSKQTLAIPRKQQLPQTFHPAQNSGLNRDEEEDDVSLTKNTNYL